MAGNSEELTSASLTKGLTRFGRYTLIQKIAHGGMATLYLARLDGPVGFEKLLALKKIHPHLAEEREFVRMFLDEARFAALIRHPNVVQIFELGVVEGEYFFAMEYLEGENLAAVTKSLVRQPLTASRPLLAYVVARTATGLHAAHELRGSDGYRLGLVHRDVSPHNVLVTYDGLVKLLDFGIAKATSLLSQTATGELKGKYAYLAPEQLHGKGQVDRRTDIFSLGVVLYEATTLRRLFKDQNDILTLTRIARCEIPRPRQIDPEYPPELEAIVLRALHREPSERYQTAADLATDLDRWVQSTGESIGPSSLGCWMSERFADSMEQKRRIHAVARQLPAATEATAEHVPEPRRWPKWPLYAALAMLVALVGTLAILLLGVSLTSPTGGTLRVRSSPRAGDVYLDDGPLLGQTPLELAGLAPGQHTVTVKALGYETRETDFSIQESGQLVTVLVPLEPVAEERGTLEIPRVEGLEVVVDDDDVRRATPLRLELAPGEHRVVVDGPQGARYETQLVIEAGRTTVMTPPPLSAPGPDAASGRDGGLERATPERVTKGYGYLNLGSSPWAEVFLGGRRLGTTPLVKVKLPAGRVRLKLLPEGRTPAKSVLVHIKRGSTTRRTVNITR